MVRGRVTDAISGAPIGRARVTLTLVVDKPEGTFGHNPCQSLTAVDGAFAFDAVQPGQYIINVEKSGFGREMSVHALEHYTQVKSVWVDLNM